MTEQDRSSMCRHCDLDESKSIAIPLKKLRSLVATGVTLLVLLPSSLFGHDSWLRLRGPNANGVMFALKAGDPFQVQHTNSVSTAPADWPMYKHDPRVLALPSPMGGLQSGCATDGRTIFTNGIDALRLGTQDSPFASLLCSMPLVEGPVLKPRGREEEAYFPRIAPHAQIPGQYAHA